MQSSSEVTLYDNLRCRLFAILTLVTGAQVVIVQPMVVQGLTEYAGFDPATAGYILSAEMWGFAVMAIAMVVLVSRFSWHGLLYLALGMICLGNLASLLFDSSVAYAAMRFVTGLGAGVLVSLAFACLGLTANPDRNFGFGVMAALTYGAVVVTLAPLLFRMFGFDGFIYLHLLLAGLCFSIVRFLPRSGSAQKVEGEAGPLASLRLRWFALVAMLVYFAAQGAIWSYLYLVGTHAGISEGQVAKGLGISQFWGIAGALTAAVVASRFGRAIPLVLGILLGIVPITMLLGQPSYLIYTLLVGVYTYGWNMTHPYLLGVMATLDASGSTVVYAVAMQKIGLAVGPALAAAVYMGEGYAPVLWLGIVLFLLALILILLPAKHASSSA